MAATNLKRLFADRRVLKVGTAVFEFNSPGLGQIVGAAGADFVFLDMEHSGFTIGDVKRSITGFRAGNVPVIVRPPTSQYHHIARALDAGADAIMIPMVGSAMEAEHIVNSVKYPPMGNRGVAPGLAHDRYVPGDVAKSLAEANDRTACIVMIETKEGLTNVDAICAVEGVDAVWIGEFDLSAQLGVPGDFTHPTFRSAKGEIEAAAKKHDKALCCIGMTPESAVALFNQGYDVVCYSGDVWIYQQAMMNGISHIRSQCTTTQ